MAGPDSKFCPGCGAALAADPEVEGVIVRTVHRVLAEYDIKKKAAPKGEPKGEPKKLTLAEKLKLKKKE